MIKIILKTGAKTMDTSHMEEVAIRALCSLSHDVSTTYPHSFYPWIQDTLVSWFGQSPYLTAEQYEELCAETGLTKTQVSNWFANRRRRHGNLK